MSLLQEWEEEQDRQAADKKKMARYRARQAAIRKQNKTLKADLTALRERMRWRDVRVELPDEDTAVEAFTGDNTVTTMWLERGRLEDENGVQFGDGFITHWRPINAPEPLPAAPEVQNG